MLGRLLEVLEARVWRGEGVGRLLRQLGGRLGEDAEDAGDVCVHGGQEGEWGGGGLSMGEYYIGGGEY